MNGFIVYLTHRMNAELHTRYASPLCTRHKFLGREKCSRGEWARPWPSSPPCECRRKVLRSENRFMTFIWRWRYSTIVFYAHWERRCLGCSIISCSRYAMMSTHNKAQLEVLANLLVRCLYSQSSSATAVWSNGTHNKHQNNGCHSLSQLSSNRGFG